MVLDTSPPYTPSSPSPDYSSELLPGEQTVETTRRTSSRPSNAVYRRITDQLTVILKTQYPGSVYPTYGRGGLIQGDLILNNTEGLTSVVLKLEGQFLLHASWAPLSDTFLSTTHVLWSASHAQKCPRTIPFAVLLPLTFNESQRTRALPPTFESSSPHAACSYSLTIGLSRPRQFLSLLKEHEVVKMPFVYCPKSRAPLPMLPSDLPFLSTVKSTPEEWHEVIRTIPMTQASGWAHAECLLFIPAVQTFAFSDIIPFHVQIRGSSACLAPFHKHDQGVFQGASGKEDCGVDISVYLLRQISVKIHDQSATATQIIGEGKMEPSQPLRSGHHGGTRRDSLESLDWDGVVRCSADVTVPSFLTNQFAVKDFVVLSITPRQPLKSPVLVQKYSCPIRLVTDPWSGGAVT